MHEAIPELSGKFTQGQAQAEFLPLRSDKAWHGI